MFQKMSRVTLFIATTLDGKIARRNGELDWLMNRPNPNQLDFGYHEFLSTVGAIVLGKTTYKEILGFGIEWPYTRIPAYVATTDPKFQAKTPDTYTFTTDLTEFVTDLRQKIKKDIWLMGGGQLISTFLKNDLLDRMILTLIPTTIGEGISLFQEINKETKWALTHVERFETGVINLTYDKETC
ncbi:MAG: dihydrofolate reductase family protein [Bacteroidia bacterium]